MRAQPAKPQHNALPHFFCLKSCRNIEHPDFVGIWRALHGTYGTRIFVGSQHMAPMFFWGLAGHARNIWHPRFCGIWRATRGTYGTRVSAGSRGPCVEHGAPAFLREFAGSAWNIWHPRFGGSPRALRGTYGTRVSGVRGVCSAVRTSGCGLWRQRRLLRILLSREDEQIRVRLAQELSHFAAPVASLLALPQQASGGYLCRQLRQLPAAVDEHCTRRRLSAGPLFVGVLRHHLSLCLAHAFSAICARAPLICCAIVLPPPLTRAQNGHSRR